MNTRMNDLDTLVPQGIELVIDGEPLAVKPLKVGQLPAFLRAISPVMQQLTASEIDWLGLFGRHGEDILTAVAIAVGKPRVWVDELAADEAILLAAKVIEVNADFFTRTVLPRLDGLFVQAREVMPMHPATAVGSTPSSA